MQTYIVNETKTPLGEFLNWTQHGPVQIMQYNQVLGIIVNPQDYQEMQTFYANRLLHTLDEAAEIAKRAGLTSEKLDGLLIDES